MGGNNSFDWRITRHAHFWPHRQARQQLWPRTTKRYDRSSDTIRLGEVEQITLRASTCRVLPMLTAEDVVKRIAAECAFADDRCAVGIRLKAAVAIVREYGEIMAASLKIWPRFRWPAR